MTTAVTVPLTLCSRFRSVCVTMTPDRELPFCGPGEKETIVGFKVEDQDVLNRLLQRSRQGDTQAMGEIYEQFKVPLYNLALRYTYNSAAAEDILQDIFVKIFTSLESLKNDDAFVGWLYRIAVNASLSHLRSRKRVLQKTVSLEDVEYVLQGGDKDPSFRIQNRSLEEAIRALPTKLKSVFLLHDVQGFKHEEIGRILGVATGTSKSQLFKARMKLRTHLNKTLCREGEG